MKKYGLREFTAAHALTAEKHGCYGVYNGYRIHVRYRFGGNPACLLTVVADAGEKKKIIEQFLEKKKAALHIAQFGVAGIGLMVSPRLRGDFRRAEALLAAVTAKLKKLGCAGADACPYCGRPLDESAVDMRESGIPFRAHEACFAAARRSMAEREAREAARADKKLAGTAGMALGTLAGLAVTVLTFLWFGFGALGTPAAVLLAWWMYGKCGGKPTAFRAALCSAVPVALTFAAYFGCLLLEASADPAAAGSVFARLAESWRQPAYRTAVIVNIACFAAFAAASVLWVCHLLRRARSKFDAERLVQRME